MTQRKTKSVTLFFTPDEMNELRQRSDTFGVTVVDAIRMAVRATHPDPAVQKAYMETLAAHRRPGDAELDRS